MQQSDLCLFQLVVWVDPYAKSESHNTIHSAVYRRRRLYGSALICCATESHNTIHSAVYRRRRLYGSALICCAFQFPYHTEVRWIPFCFSQSIYDPSAGSPTETLLRLLLPLSAPVRVSYCRTPLAREGLRFASPKISLVHSIGSSDGRCVQRAGTDSQRALWPATTRHS